MKAIQWPELRLFKKLNRQLYKKDFQKSGQKPFSLIFENNLSLQVNNFQYFLMKFFALLLLTIWIENGKMKVKNEHTHTHTHTHTFSRGFN